VPAWGIRYQWLAKRAQREFLLRSDTKKSKLFWEHFHSSRLISRIKNRIVMSDEKPNSEGKPMNRLWRSNSPPVRFAPAPGAGSTTAFRRLLLIVLFVLGTACALQAQSIIANAQISGQAAGGGGYNYTITLNNTAASTSPIGTFWYSWIPGEDFLPSSPTSVQPPTGWTDTITHVPVATDGYAIEFTASTSLITPGSSLAFKFSSPDSPVAIVRNSPFYLTTPTPVGTSFLYGGTTPFSGASAEIVVQSVPEPSSLGLLMAGAIGLLAKPRQARFATGFFYPRSPILALRFRALP
jgi:hypothetical protein